MTTDFELDGRLPSTGFISPGKSSVELVPPLHEAQARKIPEIGRSRVQGGDISRAEGPAIAEKAHTDASGFCGEATKPSQVGAAVANIEIAHVRADDQLACDTAEPDSQKVVLSKLRDSRIEDGHGLCEDDEPTGESLQAKAGKTRSRILQEAVSQGVRQVQLLQQQQHPQPQQAPVVRWERFLPQRQLRVLLVEDDDSTRHVVSALLRNCSYEVTFAANGSLAWELLLDQTNRIDLVLTEVVMPGLSGIGLLSRILGHEAFKHIPVIMMSSHDSMGIVFKCLSKGAVDFLVKPVRKNELKNLWQHVWRRCHSSSGSGSGSSSGSQTQKVASPKAAPNCNISGSNDESENASSGLNAVGGSDNGSRTQSSWTKKAVEVESSQHQPDKDLTHPNTSLTHRAPKQPEVQQDSVKGHAFAVEPHEEKYVDAATAQGTGIACLQLAATDSTSLHKDKKPSKSAYVMSENVPKTSKGGGILENAENGLLQEDSIKAIDLINGIAGKDKSSVVEEQGESGGGDNLLENHASNSPVSKDKTVSDFNSPPLLELSLKRPSHFEEDGRERNGGHVLRHSCSSAFSRYNTSGNHSPSPTGNFPNIANYKATENKAQTTVQRSNGGSSNPSVSFPKNSEMVASSPCGLDAKIQVSSLSNLPHVNSKQDGCLPSAFACQDDFAAGMVKDDVMHLHSGSETGVPMSIPLPHGIMYDGLSSGYGPLHHPMFYVGHANAAHWGSQTPTFVKRSADDDCCASHEQSPAHPTPPLTSHNAKSHHHSHHYNHHHIQPHYHHHHHHQHLPEDGPLTQQLEDQTVTNVGGEAPVCGSSNVVNGPEGNTDQSGSTNGYGSNGNGNGSVNGSATGSNNGSNNGQSAVAAGGNGDSCPKPGSSGTGTENGLTANNGSLSGLDQNRFAMREAALTKFRQKRKERCFEKKVRYQSRKRLAEQRPRVRGQFVRQSVNESAGGEPG